MESLKDGEGICPTCTNPLELSKSNFNRGKFKRCKTCYSKRYGKEWYERNKERVKSDSRNYYRQTAKRRRQVARENYHALAPSERKRLNRKNALKRKYGITLEEYEAMFTEQKGLCFLCGEAPRIISPSETERLAVDHCHVNRKVRKLLCKRCNFFLGIIERDPDWVTRAIEYLKS